MKYTLEELLKEINSGNIHLEFNWSIDVNNKSIKELHNEIEDIIYQVVCDNILNEQSNPFCYHDPKDENDEYVMIPLSTLQQWRSHSQYNSQQIKDLAQKNSALRSQVCDLARKNTEFRKKLRKIVDKLGEGDDTLSMDEQ